MRMASDQARWSPSRVGGHPWGSGAGLVSESGRMRWKGTAHWNWGPEQDKVCVPVGAALSGGGSQ